VLDLFAQYLWPGNVRQLRNEIKRAVAMSQPGGTLSPEMLSPELASLTRETPASPLSVASRRLQAASLAAAVEHLERDLIQAALDRSQGNISETARQLGLTRRGLYLKLRRLGLEMPAGMDTQ